MALALEGRYIRRLPRSRMINPFWWLMTLGYRFWWHIKAYATILGVMALALLCLLALHLYQFIEKWKPRLVGSHPVIKKIYH